MWARTALVVGALTTAAFGLAGCTTTANGNPAPGTTNASSPSEPTTPSTEQDSNGAPRVAHPLDPTKFLADPCSTLTQSQLAGFGVTSKPPVPNTEGPIAEHSGPGCVWNADTEVNSTIGVLFVTADKNGLADLYGVREREAYFEETMVNGYPAVLHDQVDRRDRGACGISVGVSDSLPLYVTEQGDLDAQGACDRVKQIAGAVITTMKVGA